MYPSADFVYDAASALSRGRREHQEDSVVADFPVGAGMGFAVLADGMGGHAAGDVASKIAVTEVFSELKLQTGDPAMPGSLLGQILHDALMSANECVRYHAEANPETEGMGTTLVAPVVLADRLYWISVGDSPLYLFRDGELHRLNEDHSMVPQIEFMVARGIIDSQMGLNHPDRNCVTSVLIGADIPQIDCPAEPLKLRAGDIVLVASDGLQFLTDDEIAALVAAHADRSSAEISAALMRALERLDDPDQDNTSICVIRVAEKSRAPAQVQTQAATAPDKRKRSTVAFMATKGKSKNIRTYRVSLEKSA